MAPKKYFDQLWVHVAPESWSKYTTPLPPLIMLKRQIYLGFVTRVQPLTPIIVFRNL